MAGRVALVTGGTRGIGAAISRMLKLRGYNVAANYAGNDVAASAFKEETGIAVYKFDVSKFDAVKTAVAQIEKDLGPVALPRVPTSPTPFAIAEYFPTEGVTPYFDARQHAVALAYVVPVDGDCEPSQNALDIVWLSPEEAASQEISSEMAHGQDTLLRQGLAHCGVLP